MSVRARACVCVCLFLCVCVSVCVCACVCGLEGLGPNLIVSDPLVFSVLLVPTPQERLVTCVQTTRESTNTPPGSNHMPIPPQSVHSMKRHTHPSHPGSQYALILDPPSGAHPGINKHTHPGLTASSHAYSN